VRDLLIKLVLLATCGGCSVTAPQVSALITSLEYLKSPSPPELSSDPPLWFASVGETGAQVTPYIVQDLTVFANSEGDALAFDGWIIRSVVGFGLDSTITTSGLSGRRVITVGDEVTVSVCRPWYWEKPFWRQLCNDGFGAIELSEQGEIQTIKFRVASLGVIYLELGS